MEGIHVKSISEENLKKLLEQFPKLNELSDHQMEAVKEAVKESFSYGFIYGEAIDKKEVKKEYEGLISKLLLARAFFASITALLIGNYVSKYTTDASYLILLTSVINTSVFFVLRWITASLRRSEDASRRNEKDS